jgi:hypothetical protein
VLLGGHAPIASHYGGANADQGGPFANNDNDPSFEVFSPPYLFRGPRPTITHAPAGVSYGEQFAIGTPHADDIASVELIRTPSPQHINDSDQRMVMLEFHRTSSNGLEAVAPPTGVTAPPGYYYLVVNRKTDRGEVPSVARMVHVGDQSDSAEAFQPFPDDSPAPVGGSATAIDDSSAATSSRQAAGHVAKAVPAPQPHNVVLSAVPAGTRGATVPDPRLPVAAVMVAAVAARWGRRWFTRSART